MSPEQAFGRKLDWRSDIFSAGSVLYELSTSVAPFQAANEIDLIFAVRDAAPAPCRNVNRHIPVELGRIIEKSMSRSRSGRYQTAMAFRDALLRFLRRYNPGYRRTKLGRLMKRLWADDIEQELRALEDFVVDVSSAENLGRNLIADALGPNATYNKFSPNPTRTTDPTGESSEAAGVHQARTEIIDAPRVGAPESLPDDHEHTIRTESPDAIHTDKTIVPPPHRRGRSH